RYEVAECEIVADLSATREPGGVQAVGPGRDVERRSRRADDGAGREVAAVEIGTGGLPHGAGHGTDVEATPPRLGRLDNDRRGRRAVADLGRTERLRRIGHVRRRRFSTLLRRRLGTTLRLAGAGLDGRAREARRRIDRRRIDDEWERRGKVGT